MALLPSRKLGQNLFGSTALIILLSNSAVFADNWTDLSGGMSTSGVGASPSKVGIGLSAAGIAPQRLTLGVATGSTEYVFGQFAGTGGSGNLSGLRIGGGAGTTDWAGMEVKQTWITTPSGHTENQISFYTSNATTSTSKMTILANGNVGIGVTNPSSKLEVGGQTTLNGLVVNGGASAQGGVYTTASIGLALQGKTGSSYDFSVVPASGSGYILRVPTGTTTAEFPNNVSVSGLSNLSGLVINGGASGQGGIYTTPTIGLALQGKTGSAYDFSLLGTSGVGSYVLRVPTGTTTAEFPSNVTIGGNLTTSVSIVANGQTAFVASGAANTARDALSMRTDGINRWIIRNSAGTETGGGTNSGSSFQLIARADDGASIDNVIDITRAAGGAISLSRPVVMSSALTFSNNGVGADFSIWRSAGAGMVMRGGAGTSYDLSLMTPAGTYLLRNPSNTQSLEFPGTGTTTFAGPVVVAGGLNLTAGDLTVGSNSTPYELNLNGPNGQNRGLNYKTAGLNRWRIMANSNTESGSNAGSDLIIAAYNDGGSFLSNAIAITRSNRTVAMSDNATVGGSLTVSGQTNVGNGTGTSALIVAGASGSSRSIQFNTGTTGGSGARWTFEAANIPETGSNAGTPLQLTARADNGSVIDNPISITRVAGGPMVVSRPISANAITAAGAITSTNSGAGFIHTGAAGLARDALTMQTAGSYRWLIRNDSDPESGANTGSSFSILARADNGTPIDVPLSITRAAGGAVTLSRPVSMNSTLMVSGSITGQNTITANGQNGFISNGAAGLVRDGLNFKTNGVNRWIFRNSAAPESGGNAGSSFQLMARADDGSGIDFVIDVTRAAGGPMTLSRPTTLSAGLTSNGPATFQGGRTQFLNPGNSDMNIGTATSGNDRMIFGWEPSTHRGYWEVGGSMYPLTIQGAGGRVVVGGTTDDGATNLQVVGSQRITGALIVSGKTSIGYPSSPNPITAQSADLTIKSTGVWNTDYSNNLDLVSGVTGRPSLRFSTVSGTDSKSAWIATDALGSLYFGVGRNTTPVSAGQIPMTITAGANVALATNPGGQVIVGSLGPSSTPGVKLNVEGNARVSGTVYASSVKTTSWGIEPTPPDYVFEKGYKLASLDHVEKFVNANKHLPEVPSAKQIMKGGLDLSDMNMKLLKKVEELTLYAISQNKRTMAQDKEIAELKKIVHEISKSRKR